MIDPALALSVPCPLCGGTDLGYLLVTPAIPGTIAYTTCPTCGGKGAVPTDLGTAVLTFLVLFPPSVPTSKGAAP